MFEKSNNIHISLIKQSFKAVSKLPYCNFSFLDVFFVDYANRKTKIRYGINQEGYFYFIKFGKYLYQSQQIEDLYNIEQLKQNIKDCKSLLVGCIEGKKVKKQINPFRKEFFIK